MFMKGQKLAHLSHHNDLVLIISGSQNCYWNLIS